MLVTSIGYLSRAAFWTGFVVLSLAFIAAPAYPVELISNGDFSVAPNTINNVTEAQALDVWWRQSGSQQFIYDGANDQLDLDTNNNRYRGIAQIIDDSAATTTGLIDFAVDIDYQAVNGTVEVEVWGIEAGDTFSLDLGAGNSSTGPSTDNTADLDLLAASLLGSPLNANSLTNVTLMETLDIGLVDYEALGLRVLAHGFDTNATPTEELSINSVSFSTVEAQAIPEPASIALWTLIGLALGFSYYRSRYRK